MAKNKKYYGENVLISVLSNNESANIMLNKLNNVLNDFTATCGKVAELEVIDNKIYAKYIQSDNWEGFLSGIAWAILNPSVIA